MKTVNLITGAVVLVLVLAMGYEALQLRYYTPLGPGPGFFGVWLAVIGAVLAIGTIVAAARSPAKPLPANFWPESAGWLRMGGVLLGLALLALLLETVGYVIMSFLFLVAVMFVMGERRVFVNLPVALAGSFGVYYLFVHLLQTRLPAGIFGV